MAKEIVLSWTKDGYSFTIDGVKQDFSVRSAAMKMGLGRVPAVVIEIDADLVRMEHGLQGYRACSAGELCNLSVGHDGDHELEPVQCAEEAEPAEL